MSRTTTGPFRRALEQSGALAGRIPGMEASPRNRSWGDLLLDALCIGMVLISVTGMLYILLHH
ncbi:MAG TPA: hypothetical protein VFM77_16740 [Terriglobales bacterium]|nr:hypothetical protein [Terriglobales bacterium]